LAQSGRFASEPEAVALDCALRFESPPNSRPSIVCLCRASCFGRLLSPYRCCRSSRRLRRLINGRRHAGTATASCRAIISHRITAFQLTPRKLRFRAWRVKPASLVYRSNPKLLRVRWRLALFRPAWLLRRSLQWRQLRPLLDADADRTDLELRLIKLSLKDRRVCVRLPARAAHGAKRTSAPDRACNST